MTRSAGRPRDPEVDGRIASAAVAEFADRGWSAFTMEGVARRAGVGKASLYLRWSDKAELLLDSLDQAPLRVRDIDTGDIRGDLVALAGQMMTQLLEGYGTVMLRLGVDAEAVPGLGDRLVKINDEQVLAARAIVRRAIGRGELPRATSVTMLLDLLAGAILNHVLVTPPALRERMAARSARYTRDLVDAVLRTFTTEGKRS